MPPDSDRERGPAKRQGLGLKRGDDWKKMCRAYRRRAGWVYRRSRPHLHLLRAQPPFWSLNPCPFRRNAVPTTRQRTERTSNEPHSTPTQLLAGLQPPTSQRVHFCVQNKPKGTPPQTRTSTSSKPASIGRFGVLHQAPQGQQVLRKTASKNAKFRKWGSAGSIGRNEKPRRAWRTAGLQISRREFAPSVLAETQGFEPWIQLLTGCTLSRGVPSTTRPRLLIPDWPEKSRARIPARPAKSNFGKST